jgi:hypothetical protein
VSLTIHSEDFLAELDKVWKRRFDTLVPGVA